MKQVELNKKSNSNYLNIFSLNEKYFLFIGAIISILWLTLLTKYNFGKGIDFFRYYSYVSFFPKNSSRRSAF